MGRIAQVAEQRQDRDVENVISEASPIRPTAGDGPVIEEASLGSAVKHIATKNTETMKTGGVGSGAGVLTASQAHRARGKVHFDQVRNEDAGKIGAVN